MKIERLLGIIILLLNRNLVQAKDLAERFEVSIRTIYRDIETINQAGIPIVTYQGINGGISLADGYRLDRQLLTNKELITIVTALQSIATIHQHPQDANHALVEKINTIIPKTQSEQFQSLSQQVIYDFSHWGQHSKLEEILRLLKQAIDKNTRISFIYRNAKGEVHDRLVEPYTLVRKGPSWYLYAFCCNKQDFRFFKVYRMKDLQSLNEPFTRQSISTKELPWNQSWRQSPSIISLVLRFDPDARHLAEEYFGVEKVQPDQDGYSLVYASFPEDDWLYGFILSFGPLLEVIEPIHVRERIKDLSAEIVKKYE